MIVTAAVLQVWIVTRGFLFDTVHIVYCVFELLTMCMISKHT